MTTRIKGMRSRIEVEAPPVSVVTITDLPGKQVIVLRPEQKTATIAAVPAAAVDRPAAAPGAIDASMKPTGKSQVIDGVKCDEYAFSTSLDMSAMTGSAMPPEAAAMMQGMKVAMTGSMWVAKDVPGAQEYVAFQKALASSDMAAAAAGASGIKVPGMDRIMKAMGSADGMTYLLEMTMTVDGSGQLAEMMKQMGAMKITTRTTSVKSDTVSDDLFKVPEGYTIVK
jgi:hypothetical protein